MELYAQPIIHMMPQGSEEWKAIRRAKVTASCLDAVCANGRGGAESKTRNAYLMRLLAELVSGLTQDTYSNGEMQWGTETEPLARQAYEMDRLCYVQQVGFVQISDYAGCSPDGFVDEDGQIEIKCPKTTTHLQYVLDNQMPSDYYCQVQGQLWMTGRKWCDFLSFDPRIKDPKIRLWRVRVERDEAKINEIKTKVERFVTDLLELERKIKGE